MKTGMIGLVWFMLLFSSGCRIIQPVDIQTGHYYINPEVRFSTIGKVAVLELENQSTRSEQSELMTQNLADSMGKKHIFSVQCIYRSDPVWQSLQLDSISQEDYEQLAHIREQLRVDAIVFGTICRYSSYPNFLTHLRLKMISLQDGKMVWAMEEVWDSADKKTAQRMQQFFKGQMRQGYAPINWQIMITSPRAFSRFVTFEAAQTLPAVMSGPTEYQSAGDNIGLFSGLFTK